MDRQEIFGANFGVYQSRRGIKIHFLCFSLIFYGKGVNLHFKRNGVKYKKCLEIEKVFRYIILRKSMSIEKYYVDKTPY